MKADPYDIKTVFGFERQLFAPLFQRPYVWSETDQWQPLWNDIHKVAELLLAGKEDCKPHFLGAVVLDQMRTSIGKPDARSIIDGQQRLTTLQLLIEALRDLCHSREPLAMQRRRLEKMLYNEDVSDAEDRYKVWPTNVDRPVYKAIMDTTSPAALARRITEACQGKRTQLAKAYQYFHRTMAKWLDLDGDDGVTRCEALVNAIREKIRLVIIDMDDQDDAQVIFETLNARGTPLLPSDLVKNFLFRRAQDAREDVVRLHDTYWEPFDVEDTFWREKVRVGRLFRARIDVYLQHYLSLQKRSEVAMGELFTEFQNLVARNPERNAEWHLRMFHRHAQHYKHFCMVPPDTREGVFFERLSDMETTTVFPFLLGLYEADVSEDDRLAILLDLESFLVRRTVCRLTTQGYNRLFLDLVAGLAGGARYTREAVQGFLLAQTLDSQRWPADDEFRDAWMSVPLYRAAKRARLRMLLRALDSALHDGRTEPYTLKRGLTVEHIMPQQWEHHWPLSPQPGETPEEFDARKQRRNSLVHTIGNLALLTQSLNPTVSNGSFETKKEKILRHSAINLNRFLYELDRWDEEGIMARGQRLCDVAMRIWPHAGRQGQIGD